MRRRMTSTLLLASALVAGGGGINAVAAVEGSDTTVPDGTAAVGEAPSLDFSGPNGETPTPSSELELTDEEIEQVRSGGYTAALVWHENSAFIQAVEAGVREEFDELGIEVVASTSAEFDAAQQAANIETVLATNPDIIVTIAVDPTTAAEAFRPAVEQGVKIVVLTTPPAGYTAGEEIVGIVTGELTAYGKAAAEMLGESLGGEGQVGWIFHDADFWFTNQRDQAFKDWLAYLYPDMEVVDEAGFTDPARTEEIANAMITPQPRPDRDLRRLGNRRRRRPRRTARRRTGRRQRRHQRPRREPRTRHGPGRQRRRRRRQPGRRHGAEPGRSWPRTECWARKPRDGGRAPVATTSDNLSRGLAGRVRRGSAAGADRRRRGLNGGRPSDHRTGRR